MAPSRPLAITDRITFESAYSQTTRDLSDTFWLVPALMVLGGVLAGVGFVELDRSDVLPEWLLKGPWLYNGGATGARTMLGAIASSTIGVAGTVFAITIAALSLAAGRWARGCCATSRVIEAVNDARRVSLAHSRTR